MDKTFAFELIGFFIVCACFITWSATGVAKANRTYRILGYSYAALTWICIVALTVLTILY